MFGMLKKKLEDIVKKFSKTEEEKIEESSQKAKEEQPLQKETPAPFESSEPETEPQKVADMLGEAEVEIKEMEKEEETEKAAEQKALLEEPQIVPETPDENIFVPKEVEELAQETMEEEKEIEQEDASISEKLEEAENNIIPEVEKEFEKSADMKAEPEPELIEDLEETLEEKQEDAVAKEVEIIENMAKEEPEDKKKVLESDYSNKAGEPAAENISLDINKPAFEPSIESKEIEERHNMETKNISKQEHKPEKKGFLQMLFGKKESSKPEKIIKSEEPKKLGIVGRITEKEITHDEAKKLSSDLKIALIASDVALDVSEKICSELERDMVGKIVKRGETENIVKESLRKSIISILDQGEVDIESIIEKCKSESRPATIIFLGFNGTGKTTNLSKLAYRLKKNGHIPVLAAGDTFRAASIEQLEIHAKNIGAGIVKQTYGSDSAAVIFDARKHAKANGNDVVLADTAGRSHGNANLMEELKKVIRVNNPDLKILVLDSLTGNDIVEQAQKFNDAVGVDGIILSKADVYEKGGAALSAAFTIKKPILFLGIGQGYEDLKKFDPKEIANNLLE